MPPLNSKRASSPVKFSAAAAMPFLHHEPDFQDIRKMLESEMRCSLVGPQPVEQFLNTFLPLPSDGGPGSVTSIDFSQVIEDIVEESTETIPKQGTHSNVKGQKTALTDQ